jgi:hypothetical protein
MLNTDIEERGEEKQAICLDIRPRASIRETCGSYINAEELTTV